MVRIEAVVQSASEQYANMEEKVATIRVESDYYNKAKVRVTIGDKTITVLADDLIRAVEAAQKAHAF